MIICPNCGWEANFGCNDCEYEQFNEVSRLMRIIKKVIRQ